MRPTDRNRFQRYAERKFPIKDDIPVPPGAWAQHGYRERRKGERPLDFARFVSPVLR